MNDSQLLVMMEKLNISPDIEKTETSEDEN